MWKYFNPNPAGRNVGDCAVRAVSAALGISWEDAYREIADAGFDMADMPSSNAVWGAVLRKHGFYRANIPDFCPDCYTAEDFAHDHPKGVFILGFGTHTACIRDSVILDSWDSSQELPQYFWYRGEL